MTVEPSYRINPKADNSEVFHAISLDPGGEPAMIPDGRLQAITDAWAAHTQAMGEGQFRSTQSKLHALLDALAEEKS